MIQEIKEVPCINPQTSQRQMIRDDIEYALNNRIKTFEFEGDYNWKYLAQYTRDVSSRIFMEKIYQPARDRVKKKLEGKYDTKYPYPIPYWKYTKNFITIHSRKLEDRIHVYATIDHDFVNNFEAILLRDTIKKYEKG